MLSKKPLDHPHINPRGCNMYPFALLRRRGSRDGPRWTRWWFRNARWPDGRRLADYVLILVLKITDADVFKATMSGLMNPSAAFAGRLAVDEDKPAAWEGTAPEHIVMIQFDSPD